MAGRLVAAAAGATATNRGVAQALRILRIVGYVVAGWIAILVVGLIVLIVFCAAMFVVMRLNGPDSPLTRRMAARLVARSSPRSAHRADQRGSPSDIAAGLDAIRTRDALFDQQVVLEAARRALFCVFVAGLDGDDSRLRQVSTAKFWKTPAGEEVEERARARAAYATSTRPVSGFAEGVAIKGLTPVVLDYNAHEAELWAVQPDIDGVDRVTVRLAFRGEAALAGPGASRRAMAMTGRFNLSAARELQGQGAGPALAVDSARLVTQGWYDLEFVRPAAARSSPGDGIAERRCANCGAPYRSDLDVACSNCRSERSTPAGGWQVDRSWLVVDTEAHAGQGLNRDRHDGAWALRGVGKIALKVGEGLLD